MTYRHNTAFSDSVLGRIPGRRIHKNDGSGEGANPSGKAAGISEANGFLNGSGIPARSGAISPIAAERMDKPWLMYLYPRI